MNGETNPKIRETEEQNPTACDLRLVGYSSAVMTNTNTKHAPEAHWPIRKNTNTPIVFYKKRKENLKVKLTFSRKMRNLLILE